MEIPPLISSIAGSVTRWALTGLGAYLVKKGIVSESDVAQVIAGAGVALASLAWSIWEKWQAALATERLKGGDPNGV